MAKRQRQVYSFAEKKYSANGVASTVLGLISAVLFFALLFVAFLMKGRANAWIGAMGLTGIVMGCCGLRYGFAGFKDECRSYFCSRFGTIVSMLSIVGWFFIVCLGLA